VEIAKEFCCFSPDWLSFVPRICPREAKMPNGPSPSDFFDRITKFHMTIKIIGTRHGRGADQQFDHFAPKSIRQTTLARSHLSVSSIDGINIERGHTTSASLPFVDISAVDARDLRSDDSNCAGDSVSDLQSTLHGAGESAGPLQSFSRSSQTERTHVKSREQGFQKPKDTFVDPLAVHFSIAGT
jgi:hypothetical protein